MFRCYLLWYIEACYGILDGHILASQPILFFFKIYVYLYYHLYFSTVEFPERFSFSIFFHIDFLVFSVMFSFQVLFVPFSLMIMFFDKFLCWYMFKHVQTYTKARDLTPRMVFFSHAQSKQRGCGCLRDYAKCYYSSKFSYVAFCCFMFLYILYYLYIYICIYIYIT